MTAKDRDLWLGAHISIARGFSRAAETALSMGANTFQFFTRNPRGGRAKDLSDKDLDALKAILEEEAFGPLLAHGPYSLNLASKKQEVRAFSEEIFRKDMDRLARIPAGLYNLHPGNHLGDGVEAGLDRLIDSLNRLVEGPEGPTILLETMAGKGTELGRTFEELGQVLDGVKNPDRLGVCFDTCHVFDSGYDIKDDLSGVLTDLDRWVGLAKVKAVHLNDSLYGLGSSKDRHAGFGQGKIGQEALFRLLTNPAFSHLPFFLETPYDPAGHKLEIDTIKELLDHGY